MSFLKHIGDMAGDLLGRVTGTKQANEMAQSQFDSQMDESIQRRVADGLKAGINPLAAIGASANVQPTIHSGGSNGADPTSLFSMFGSAAKGLKNMLLNKQEDDIAYDNEAKNLDIESRKLDNRIKSAQLSTLLHNLNPSSKEVPNEQPTRTGDKPLFSIAYDMRDRPRLVVNQDVMEGDADNPGYLSSIKHAITSGLINPITGEISSDQERMRLDDMYYNMTGRHIQNLDQLYFAPSEGAFSTAMVLRGVS